MAPLHQEESAADDRRIFAQQKHPRRFGKVRMERVKHPEFARHVMRFRSERPERRAPQNIFAALCSNQIDQVGMAMRKLLHLETRRAAGQILAQVMPPVPRDRVLRLDGLPRYRIQMPRVPMGSSYKVARSGRFFAGCPCPSETTSATTRRSSYFRDDETRQGSSGHRNPVLVQQWLISRYREVCRVNSFR